MISDPKEFLRKIQEAKEDGVENFLIVRENNSIEEYNISHFGDLSKADIYRNYKIIFDGGWSIVPETVRKVYAGKRII